MIIPKNLEISGIFYVFLSSLLESNARRQLLEIAKAKNERRLFPVGYTPLFGAAVAKSIGTCLLLPASAFAVSGGCESG